MAAPLLILCPTRGRPGNAQRLSRAVRATAKGAADLLFLVDDDDPQLAAYHTLNSRGLWVEYGQRTRLGPTLNAAFDRHAEDYPAVAFMGDDHHPRTPGWAGIFTATLAAIGGGIAYGNDLVHGENLPTAAALSTPFVQAVGELVPAGLKHLFVDDAWKALGQATGRLVYCPEVVIEHRHPVVGKSEMDETYAQANSPETWTADEASFKAWRADPDGLAAATRRVYSALGVVT